MGLGVCGGVLAAATAGAGDDASAGERGLSEKSQALHASTQRFHKSVGHVWYEDVLPDGESQLARAVMSGEVSEGIHLFGRKPSHGDTNANGVESALRLPAGADPRVFFHRAP